MNWRRGLFRLWIMLSAIWICGAVVAMHPLARIREAQAPSVIPIGDETVPIPAGTDAEAARRIVTDYTRRREASTLPPAWVVADGIEASVDRAMAGYRPKDLMRTVWRITRALLVPPLLLLLLGLGAMWVASGFRPRGGAGVAVGNEP